MLDISTVAILANAVASHVTPLLHKAIEKGAEEFGKSAASAFLNKFKQRLSHGGSKAALDDLAKQPSDIAAQGALAMQLRKAVMDDPSLAEFLSQWVSEPQIQSINTQTANALGDDNKTTQIVGSGNSVS